MRYTTIIDVRDCPQVYRSVTCRLVYLHLVLKSGYHDHDRDMLRTSLRGLAQDTGCTLSAVRHAVKVLVANKLLVIKGRTWYVRKWVVDQTITTRAQQRAAAKAAAMTKEQKERARERELRQEEQERQREEHKRNTTNAEQLTEMLSSGQLGTIARLNRIGKHHDTTEVAAPETR